MIDYLSTTGLMALDALLTTDRSTSATMLLRRLQRGDDPRALVAESRRILQLADAYLLLVESAIEESVRRQVLHWVLDHLRRAGTAQQPVNVLGIRSLDTITAGVPIFWYNVTGFDTRVSQLIAAALNAADFGISDHQQLDNLRGHTDLYHVSQAFQERESDILALLFEAPSLEIDVAVPAGLRERGTNTSMTFTAVYDKGSVGTPTLSWNTGATTPSISLTANNTVNVSVTATFPNPGGLPIILTATASVPFYCPIFYGAGTPGATSSPGTLAAFLDTLTRSLVAPVASRNLNFTQAVGQTRYYAQPSGQNGYDATGLSSIVNNLGYETLASWIKVASLSKTLGSATVAYDVYEYDQPTALAVTNLKNTFIQ